jgi:hypothetical protein
MTASRWSIHKPANVFIIFSFVIEFGGCLSFLVGGCGFGPSRLLANDSGGDGHSIKT